EAYPLSTLIVAGLNDYDDTCVAADEPGDLYTECEIDDDCGVTTGVCGKIAYALDATNGEGLYTCSGPLCSPGEFLDSTTETCQPCAQGTFTSTTTATSCSSCPSGSYQPDAGQTSCIVCDVGEFKTEIESITPC